MAYTYPRSEPGSGNHLELVEAVRNIPFDLAAAITGLSEEALRRHPADGEWSIKDVLAHLERGASIWCERIQAVSTLENPELSPYSPDDTRPGAHDDESADNILARLRGENNKLVELLADLVQWKWSRTGQHAEWGRMSIRQMVDRIIWHHGVHLKQIEALKQP